MKQDIGTPSANPLDLVSEAQRVPPAEAPALSEAVRQLLCGMRWLLLIAAETNPGSSQDLQRARDHLNNASKILDAQ